MKETFIDNCPYDCSSLPAKAVQEAYEAAIATSSSAVINILFSVTASKQGISTEQHEFNHAIKRLLDENSQKKSIKSLNNKWKKELDSGQIETAKKQRVNKELISTAKQWLTSETTLLKPTKSGINKVIRWSSSRWAEMRKADVVSAIYEAATLTDSEGSFLNEFSSGSVCASGSLGGSGHYSLLRVLGVTLLNANGNTTYRFEENVEIILERLNSFVNDDELEAVLNAYESEYELIKGGDFDF